MSDSFLRAFFYKYRKNYASNLEYKALEQYKSAKIPSSYYKKYEIKPTNINVYTKTSYKRAYQELLRNSRS